MEVLIIIVYKVEALKVYISWRYDYYRHSVFIGSRLKRKNLS